MTNLVSTLNKGYLLMKSDKLERGQEGGGTFSAFFRPQGPASHCVLEEQLGRFPRKSGACIAGLLERPAPGITAVLCTCSSSFVHQRAIC